jgi:AAA domain-containing protein
MIIMIRGCNGSGKTTIIRKLMKKFRANQIIKGARIVGYRLQDTKHCTYIVGRYETPTGGCDGFKTVADVEDWVTYFAGKGNVIFEGAMISTLTGRFVALAQKLEEHKFIFAVLDTPLEKCRQRIEKRQKKNGRKNSKGARPFGTKRAMQRYRGSMTSSPKFLRREGMDVRRLPHKKAFKRILKWLGEK